MVVGVGIDLFDVARIRRELEGRDPGLREELFTPAEIACCERRRSPARHYAARFAAKEAVFKALSHAERRFVAWREVEVGGDGRRPGVVLHGSTRARAEALGVRRIRLSLSRVGGLAMASVVLDG